MIETACRSLRVPQGDMAVFTAWPRKLRGPLSPVVILMDMWGFRKTLMDVAREVAAMGYYALLPDFYQRTDPVRLDGLPSADLIRKYADIPVVLQRRMRSAMDGLEDDIVVGDVEALLDAAKGWSVPMTPYAGAVGYCMGGRHAMCIAGAMPERVRASACLHGTALIRDDDRSPLRRVLAATGELYFGHAEHDEYAPADVPAKMAQILPQGRAGFAYEVHPGTHHGYALPDRAIYDRGAAARDWTAIRAMFRRQLAAAAD